MTGQTPGELSNTIVYHFDVESHSLPIDQFVDTAKATRDMLESFNHEIFGSKLGIELHVMAVEPGGLLKSLKVRVVPLAGVGAISMATLFGNAIIEVNTKHDIYYWTKYFVHEIGKRLQENPNGSTVTIELPPSFDKPTSGSVPNEEECRELAENVLVQLTKDFVQSPSDDLLENGYAKNKFKKAYAAKNGIYRACLENPEVKALGFDRSHKFSVKREGFSNHITDLPDEDLEWKHDILHMMVTSPNARKEGRRWQGVIKVQGKPKVVDFIMDDPAIWKLIETHNLVSHIGEDHMRVQWAYKNTDKTKFKDARVLRVLEFNGKQLSSRLSDEEIDDLLENATASELDDSQIDIFENSDLNDVTDISDERSGTLSSTDIHNNDQQEKLTDGT